MIFVWLAAGLIFFAVYTYIVLRIRFRKMEERKRAEGIDLSP